MKMVCIDSDGAQKGVHRHRVSTTRVKFPHKMVSRAELVKPEKFWPVHAKIRCIIKHYYQDYYQETNVARCQVHMVPSSFTVGTQSHIKSSVQSLVYPGSNKYVLMEGSLEPNQFVL